MIPLSGISSSTRSTCSIHSNMLVNKSSLCVLVDCTYSCAEGDRASLFLYHLNCIDHETNTYRRIVSRVHIKLSQSYLINDVFERGLYYVNCTNSKHPEEVSLMSRCILVDFPKVLQVQSRLELYHHHHQCLFIQNMNHVKTTLNALLTTSNHHMKT
jgi:hypothetical protein